LPLLVQTGYLTIKTYSPHIKLYTLGFPNHEVKHAFVNHLVEAFAYVQTERVDSHLHKLETAIREGNIEQFLFTMRIFFANIPHTIQLSKERYYQSVFYLIGLLLGQKMQVEVVTNIGRIDAVIEIKNQVYIFEFKLNGSKEDALQQIEDKKYFETYLGQSKTITLIGVEFNKKDRNIGDFLIKKL